MGDVWWRPEPCRCLFSLFLGVDDFLALLLFFSLWFLTLRKWTPLSLPPVGKHLADERGFKHTFFFVSLFFGEEHLGISTCVSVAILAQAPHRRCLDNAALVSRQPKTLSSGYQQPPPHFLRPTVHCVFTNLCNQSTKCIEFPTVHQSTNCQGVSPFFVWRNGAFQSELQ